MIDNPPTVSYSQDIKQIFKLTSVRSFAILYDVSDVTPRAKPCSLDLVREKRCRLASKEAVSGYEYDLSNIFLSIVRICNNLYLCILVKMW